MIVCTSNNFQIMVDSVLHRGTMSNGEEDANRPRPHFPHNQKPCGSESWSASSNLCPGHLVAADETVYLNQVDSVLYGSGVRAALLSLLLECVDPKLVCDRCKLHSHTVGLMVNIQLHHTIHQANTTLCDKDRKNRKTLKFSHF